MDIDLARHMIRAAFRNARDLGDLLQLLKEQLGPEEYKDIALGIAEAIDTIGVALTNKALLAHPELNIEIEVDLKKYGRFL